MLNQTGKVQCMECARFSLQKNAGMAKEGYGQCGLDEETHQGRFQSAVFPRLCADFTRTLDSIIQGRLIWLHQQKPGARSYLTPGPGKGKAA